MRAKQKYINFNFWITQIKKTCWNQSVSQIRLFFCGFGSFLPVLKLFPQHFSIYVHFPKHFSIYVPFPKHFSIYVHFPKHFSIYVHFPEHFSIYVYFSKHFSIYMCTFPNILVFMCTFPMCIISKATSHSGPLFLKYKILKINDTLNSFCTLQIHVF